MEALKARESGIAANLAEADAKHAEARRLLDEHRVTLAGAADQVRAMLDEARRDAEATKASIVEEAKAASEAERSRVIRDIEQARDSAVRQLAERSAGLAIDLAAKVVKQDLTPQRQSEIVREALSRFAPGDPSAN
jgi:F-type H+-transporting ATPase subunit b